MHLVLLCHFFALRAIIWQCMHIRPLVVFMELAFAGWQGPRLEHLTYYMGIGQIPDTAERLSVTTSLK